MGTEFELMVAPNGARLMPSDHPALPITAQDVAKTAKACADAGATSIHVHVRDKNGQHSLDPDLYANAVAEIAKLTPLQVQFSTEAAGIFDVADQRHCLANPASHEASVSLREIAREPELLVDTYVAAQKNGIDIQHILYDASDLTHLLQRYDVGDIPLGSQRAIFVLGRYAEGQISTPADLEPFLTALGNVDLDWSVCAFGPYEHACLLAALDRGGNVRIGFENSRTAADGSVHASNEASVAAFVEAAAKAGFQPKRSRK